MSLRGCCEKMKKKNGQKSKKFLAPYHWLQPHDGCLWQCVRAVTVQCMCGRRSQLRRAASFVQAVARPILCKQTFFLSALHFPDGIVKSLLPSLTLFVQPKPQHIGIAKLHKRDTRKSSSKRTATSLSAGGSGAEAAGNGVDHGGRKTQERP